MMSVATIKAHNESIDEIQTKSFEFEKLISKENKRNLELQDAVNHIIKEIESYRDKSKKCAIEVMNTHIIAPKPTYQKADGNNIGKEAQIVFFKKLRLLEENLKKRNNSRSEIENTIQRSKREINHLRQMRLQLDKNHSQTESELATSKEQIDQMLKESSLIVEERDKLLEKRDILIRVNQDEQQEFAEEYESMGRYINSQNEILQESLIKERKAKERNKRTNKHLSSSSTTSSFLTESQVDEDLKKQKEFEAYRVNLDLEIEMAKEVGKLTNFVLSEQSSLSTIEEKINSYESSLELLEKLTGTRNVEQLISSYVANEEDMFSLYTFIQTVNSEHDRVLESTEQLKNEIKLFSLAQEDLNHQKTEQLEELQSKLQSYLVTTSQLSEENKIYQDAVNQLSKKVSSLFSKIQCDQMDTKTPPVTQAGSTSGGSGNASTVAPSKSVKSNAAYRDTGRSMMALPVDSDSNVLEMMGAIEHRAVGIITEHNQRRSANLLATSSLSGLNNGYLRPGSNSQQRLNTSRGQSPKGPSPLTLSVDVRSRGSKLAPNTLNSPHTALSPIKWGGNDPLIDFSEMNEEEMLTNIASHSPHSNPDVYDLTASLSNLPLSKSGQGQGQGQGGHAGEHLLSKSLSSLNLRASGSTTNGDNSPRDHQLGSRGHHNNNPHTANTTANTNNNYSTSQVAWNDEIDSKPVDLASYKESMRKKLNMPPLSPVKGTGRASILFRNNLLPPPPPG